MKGRPALALQELVGKHCGFHSAGTLLCKSNNMKTELIITITFIVELIR